VLRILDEVISTRDRGAPRLAVALAAPVASAVAGAGLAGCGGGAPRGISAQPVGTATVTETVDAPATVAPRAQGSASATADGTVAALSVRDGQQVRAGQVLLRLASPQAQRQLREALAADAQAARPVTGGSAGGAATAAVPGLDVSGAQTQLAAAETAAQRALDGADAAARQLPTGRARAQALSAVAQLRAQLATSRAAAASALAQVSAGVAGVTGQVSQVGGQVQSAVAALSGAQRTQTRAAVRAAQAAVDGLVVRAPVSGTVQLGTGTATPAAAGAGSGLSSLLAQLPASVSGSLGGALGGAGGAGAGGAGGTGGSGASTSTAPVTTGSPVSAGGLLVTVYDTSQLMLDADVDETAVLAVHAGVLADVQIDAVPGAHYRATVTSVETSTGASARGGVSYRVHLTLGPGTRADGRAVPDPRPGMSAVASLSVRTDRDAVAVPAAAVVRDGERDTVWVVEGGHAHRRVVVLGAQGAEQVAVASGLRTGERVVVQGADRVRDGQQVA